MLPLILLLTLAGDGLGVHTEQKKTCLNMFNPKASLSPSLLPLPLSLALAFSHSRDEKSVVFPCDIFQRYARVVIDVFFSVYGYSGVFICNPDRRRYEKNGSCAINYKFASITIFSKYLTGKINIIFRFHHIFLIKFHI